jgi:hypothetical protein
LIGGENLPKHQIDHTSGGSIDAEVVNSQVGISPRGQTLLQRTGINPLQGSGTADNEHVGCAIYHQIMAVKANLEIERWAVERGESGDKQDRGGRQEV